MVAHATNDLSAECGDLQRQGHLLSVQVQLQGTLMASSANCIMMLCMLI